MKGPDLTGQTFERLTVIKRTTSTERGYARWLCECQCGNTTIVRSVSLRNGHTRSCGCLQREWCTKLGRISTGVISKHGHTINGRTSTYESWRSMKTRCINQNQKNYMYYGGRGIKVCDRWIKSFENFLADMGERPDGKTLDRYPDNDGNYEPGNCRWATAKQQIANRRQKAA